MKNITRAEHIKIGCQPSPSTPEETLIQNGWFTFLLFFAVSEEVGPSGYLDDLGFAVAECIDCQSAKMGYPNDEGLPEHPLYSSGLADGIGVHRFIASPWLTDTETQMRGSHNRIWGSRVIIGEPKKKPLFHFVVPMKETTFECIAHDIQIRGFHRDFDGAFTYVKGRLQKC